MALRIQREAERGPPVPEFKLQHYLHDHLRQHHLPFISIVVLRGINPLSFSVFLEQDKLYIKAVKQNAPMLVHNLVPRLSQFIREFYCLITRSFLGEKINLILFNILDPIQTFIEFLIFLMWECIDGIVFDYFEIDDIGPIYFQEIKLPEILLQLFRSFELYPDLGQGRMHIKMASEDTELNILFLSQELVQSLDKKSKLFSCCLEPYAHFWEEGSITFKVLDTLGLQEDYQGEESQRCFKFFSILNSLKFQLYRSKKNLRKKQEEGKRVEAQEGEGEVEQKLLDFIEREVKVEEDSNSEMSSFIFSDNISPGGISDN